MSNPEQPRATQKAQGLADLLYRKWQPIKALSIFLRMFYREKDEEKRSSILNRLCDYFQIRKQLPLHYEIAKILEEQAQHYSSYDYGKGYLYQSFPPAHLRGLRNTETRITEMQLRSYVSGKTVLDIGTNTGFLACSLAPICSSITGFDINPYCIQIGNAVAKYFGYTNVRLFTGRFEDVQEKATYEVILSFANHSTYDHNTQHTLEEYFQKCAAYCTDHGLLLFESHFPGYESENQLEKVFQILQTYFQVTKRFRLQSKTSGDRGRTFAVCTKK